MTTTRLPGESDNQFLYRLIFGTPANADALNAHQRALKASARASVDPYARFKVAEAECPDCAWPVPLTEDDVEQIVTCDHCGTRCKVDYDGAPDGSGYFLLRLVERRCSHPPAAWRSCPQCTDAQGGV